ncbi:N-acetylmuramoyl-L-alanine amidase [Corynebacterium timonense]|uniref:N-acetylmuramoyl-L-alanine amidase n=1 Tax=Corynebacterium timonense TaxID=441500 RepID=A0A1H1V5Y7_9CORY|nr:N-acetylmuramoyl-L-alanine amidase [Corynebacterium timonense]SDS80030.1 N-acetylmuramoyl-L-alanine amidase [Corynebacterium timonense]
MHQRRRLASSPRRANPVIAALVSAALVAVTAIGGTRILHVQSEGQGAIEVASSTTSFADGADVTIDDAAIQTQGGVAEERRVVKEFTSETPFSMVGLTWEGERDIAAFVRSERADGTWSEWFEMDHADSVPTSPKFGTEPIYVEPTTRIQVSTANVDLLDGGRTDSDAPTTANDIEAVFLDGGEGTAQGAIEPVAETYTQGMPPVISRAAWGAGYSNTPTYTEPVTAATVHHTAGSNNYTEAQAPGIVRGIWDYHANKLGWGDVGYNALVDKYGNIYEGRTGGLDRAVQGAHVGGFNQNTWGVSMLGNYDKVSPTVEGVRAMGEIIGWKAATAGFDPLGRDYHVAEFNFGGSRYAAGQGAYFANINAHRDFHFNACPGDFLYNEMGTIRTIAAEKANAVQPGASAPGRQSGSITNPDGGTTNVTSSGAPALKQLDLTGLANGDPVAIALAAGTLAGVLILFAAQYALLPSSSETVGGIELLPGLTVDKITPFIGPILEFTGNGEAAETWERFQPLLGNLTGTAGVGGSSYAFFENGIGIKDSQGTIRTLAGKIADAWLQQGADGGPLGLPTSDEYSPFSDIVRVDFQGGHISYDPQENTVNIDVE